MVRGQDVDGHSTYRAFAGLVGVGYTFGCNCLQMVMGQLKT